MPKRNAKYRKDKGSCGLLQGGPAAEQVERRRQYELWLERQAQGKHQGGEDRSRTGDHQNNTSGARCDGENRGLSDPKRGKHDSALNDEDDGQISDQAGIELKLQNPKNIDGEQRSGAKQASMQDASPAISAAGAGKRVTKVAGG